MLISTVQVTMLTIPPNIYERILLIFMAGETKEFVFEDVFFNICIVVEIDYYT